MLNKHVFVCDGHSKIIYYTKNMTAIPDMRCVRVDAKTRVIKQFRNHQEVFAISADWVSSGSSIT
jgi:hypothetical protein